MISLLIIDIYLILLLPSAKPQTKRSPFGVFFSFYLRCLYCRSNDNRKTETSRSQIHRILLEFGLDPSDYTFNSSEKPEPDPSRSAFAKYSPAEPKVSQGRPVTYAQQPPPPRPIIKRPIPKLPTNKEMNQQASPSRRTPPSPPMSQRLQDLPARESTLSADDYARTIDSLDNPPVKVIKPNNQDLFYRKEIRIRYLQPPTPPPPAPIIIREKHMPPEPPKSVSFLIIVLLLIITVARFTSHFSSANANLKHVLHHRWPFANVLQHHRLYSSEYLMRDLSLTIGCCP